MKNGRFCPQCGKPVDPPPSKEALDLEAEIYALNKKIRLAHAVPENTEWQALMNEHATIVKKYRLSGGRKWMP